MGEGAETGDRHGGAAPTNSGGSDPAAKPVRGTPRAERYAAAVASSAIYSERPIRGRVAADTRHGGTGGIPDARGLSDSSAAPIARKGVRYLRRCRTVGNDPTAKPACGTPRAGRNAVAVVAHRCYFSARRWPWIASPRSRTTACGFSRQAGGKRLRRRASECNEVAVSTISEGDCRQALPVREKKHQHNNQNIHQSRPETVRVSEKLNAISNR
jgi:hypothetical protein